MAEDKATIEAIKNLASMFPEIDKETITDIFIGCKKDFDQTVDQLLSMGVILEKKQAQDDATPPASPVFKPPPVDKPPTTPVSPTISTPVQIQDNSERERLERLNYQLSQEYRRLAEAQERNLALEKQLAATQSTIAAEYQALGDERRRLEEQQASFQADKKRLEEHLSGRLREMKEEMRKKEEEVKQGEEARRREIEHLSEVVQEERRLLDEEHAVRAQGKTEKKAEKAAREEARVAREQELQAAKLALENEVDQLKKDNMCLEQTILCLKDDAEAREDAWTAELNALRKRLTELENASVGNVQSAQDSVVGALQSLSLWLNRGVQDFQQKTVKPEDLRQELLKSLQNVTL